MNKITWLSIVAIISFVFAWLLGNPWWGIIAFDAGFLITPDVADQEEKKKEVCRECKFYELVLRPNKAFCIKILKWVEKDNWNCGKFEEREVEKK